MTGFEKGPLRDFTSRYGRKVLLRILLLGRTLEYARFSTIGFQRVFVFLLMFFHTLERASLGDDRQ